MSKHFKNPFFRQNFIFPKCEFEIENKCKNNA
jgi:hypothetical protein